MARWYTHFQFFRTVSHRHTDESFELGNRDMNSLQGIPLLHSIYNFLSISEGCLQALSLSAVISTINPPSSK